MNLSSKIRRVFQNGNRRRPGSTYREVEQAETVFYTNWIQEGMIAFDVGANVGETTLLFSRFLGETGSVHSFEAVKSTFERLKIVCETIGRTNIVLNNIAVSDKQGTVQIHCYDDNHSGWNSLAERPLADYGIDLKPIRLQEILADTIDDYCDQNKINWIDLLKIDVEGAEFQVLSGSQRMFSERRVGCCIFEYGQTTFDMGNHPDQFRNFFKDTGYSLRNIIERDPIFPGGSAATAQFAMHFAIPIA